MNFLPRTVLSALVLGACAARQPQLLVSHPTGLSGDPVHIQVTHAQAPVTLTATRAWPSPSREGLVQHQSNATFSPRPNGKINVALDAPLQGTYEGVHAAGLFWSMRDTGIVAEPGVIENNVTISADFDGDGIPDQSVDITLKNGADAAQEISAGPALPHSFLLLPEGIPNPPVIIIVGGGSGDDRTARSKAPAFLARGYAVFGLAYDSPSIRQAPPNFPDLPQAYIGIPLDQLEVVRDWLRARDDVDHTRIGLYGTSKGAEFVLAGASRIDGFAAIAAMAASNAIGEGRTTAFEHAEASSFSWRGTPLPYAADPRRADDHLTYPDARIQAEDIAAPLFVVGGYRDRIWPSGAMADQIASTRRGGDFETISLAFEKAGHSLFGDGYAPVPPSDDPETTLGTRQAQVVIWAELLAFYARHLEPTQP